MIFRRPQVVSLGAFLTVVTLPFSTFTQQMLAFDTQLFNGSLIESSVPRSLEYKLPSNLLEKELSKSQIAYYFMNTNLHIFKLVSDYEGAFSMDEKVFTDELITAAIITGMLNQTASPMTVSCPTGNCTWPIVPSVGVW